LSFPLFIDISLTFEGLAVCLKCRKISDVPGSPWSHISFIYRLTNQSN